MKLGMVISKIIVPHPILLEPAQILIHYKAYSGWLSSGLSHWKIDKITLSDAFGKILSVCKKNLILESEIPVTLRLYPGECNLPKEDIISKKNDIKEDKEQESQHIKFAPTPVVKIGIEVLDKNSSTEKEKNLLSIKDAIEIFNLPWGDDKDNRLDSDVESSRAFNTRIISSQNNSNNLNQSEIIREVMEPILKPQSTKHGRSHDPHKEIPEISEPILGPSNIRKLTVISTSPSTSIDLSINTSQYNSKDRNDNKDITYNFYDLEKANEWGPTTDDKPKSEKWKRQDDSKVLPISQNVVQEDHRLDVHEYGVTMIVKTVQFLPQRLARMFEEAEKYAKETILPLVSTYTPKFLTDFITPVVKPKYVPFNIEMTTIKLIAKSDRTSHKVAPSNNLAKSEVINILPIIEKGMIFIVIYFMFESDIILLLIHHRQWHH